MATILTAIDDDFVDDFYCRLCQLKLMTNANVEDEHVLSYTVWSKL